MYVNCVDLFDIDLTSTDDVWFVGYDDFGNGAIEHWDGSDWSKTALKSQRRFRSVSAISANDVWVVGRYGSDFMKKILIAHYDGTSPWSETISSDGIWGLSGVDMVSSSEGWAVGNQYISRYTGSWVDKWYYYPTLTSIDMLSVDDGWIVGGTSATDSENIGLILHWDGSDWSVIDNPADRTLMDIKMLSANEGWAAGLDGNILHYTNNNTNNKQVYLPLVIQ